MSSGARSTESLLLTAAERLWESGDLWEFRAEVLAQLRRVVACDVASYNELGFDRQDVFVLADPVETTPRSLELEHFSELVVQNPLVDHYRATGEGRTLRLSDFISRHALHGLDLYDEVYRKIGAEYQLAFTLPCQGQLIGITASRAGSDFGEREIMLLDAIRAIMLPVHRNLQDRARLDAVARALDVHDRGPLAVFVVAESGMLLAAHERAERLLALLAREQLAEDALRSWARLQHRARPPARTQGPDGSTTLRLDALQGELEARYLAGSRGMFDAVVIRPLEPGGPRSLGVLGLTARQAEVLHMLWQGATNAEIALALCISEHTVRHHVEQVHARLGVHSRAGAARIAAQAMARARRLPGDPEAD
jgi:DNA-binding CsgD family transcriptional regulator